MNPLEINRQVLTWLCGVPPHESDSKRKKIAYIVFTLSLIFTITTGVMASALFIYRNVSLNLEESLYSLIYTIDTSQILYQSMATVLLRRKLLAIFEGLLTIYRESETELDFFFERYDT